MLLEPHKNLTNSLESQRFATIQAVDYFTIEQTSNQIISELGAFKKQWDLFLEKLELVGKRIEATQKEYESLNNTRR